jgi:MinD-like ATPase involved in chromosome partitioning or flagellar assembly
MSKLVIFTMGGKGGVGKTASLVSLVEYFDDNNISRKLIDCDLENKKAGSLIRFFPEAEKVNIRKPNGLDVFIDIASSNDAPIVVADLGAGSSVDLIGWFGEMYPAAEELGISFVAVGSITANPGSVETVFTWGKALQKKVKYLIIKNLFQGTPDLWDFGEKAIQFKEGFSVDVLEIKSRIPEWQTELENHGLTLTKAMNSALPMFDRISAKCRLHMWRKQIFNEFDRVKETFIPV